MSRELQQRLRREIQPIEASQRLSIQFLSDGSLKVKKGPSTIHKIGGTAVVTGRLTKELTGNASENIKYVERTLRLWVGECRNLYNGAIQLSPSGLELSALRFYKRVMVQESLGVSEDSSEEAPCIQGVSSKSASPESPSESPSNQQSPEARLFPSDLDAPPRSNDAAYLDAADSLSGAPPWDDADDSLSQGQFFKFDEESDEVYLPFSEDADDASSEEASSSSSSSSSSEESSEEAPVSDYVTRHPSGRPFVSVEECQLFNKGLKSVLQKQCVRGYSTKSPESKANIKDQSLTKIKAMSLTVSPYPYPRLEWISVPNDLIDRLESKSPKRGDPTSLEVKHEGRGVISITTRGQVSSGMGLRAVTGLQTSRDTIQESEDLLSSVGLGGSIMFTSTSLRSAKDVYLKGGHVTMDYRDQEFRLMYNNCRVVIADPENPDGSKGLVSTRPVESVEEALTLRRYSQLTRSSNYQRNTSVRTINKYTSNLELGIRAFIKFLYAGQAGLSPTNFSCYRDLIDFINKFVFSSGFKLGISLTGSYVSQVKLRNEGKHQKAHQVPRLPCILSFFDYVKDHFKDFDPSLILSKVS